MSADEFYSQVWKDNSAEIVGRLCSKISADENACGPVCIRKFTSYAVNLA